MKFIYHSYLFHLDFSQANTDIVREITHLSKKNARLFSHISFLTNCLEHKFLPKGFNRKYRLVNNSSKLRTLLFQLKLEDMSTTLQNYKDLYHKSLSRFHHLWSFLESSIPIYQLQILEENFQDLFTRFLNKFNHVKLCKYPLLFDRQRDFKVTNWSQHPLTEDQRSFLSLGPNFRLRPKSSTIIKETIAQVESHFKNNRLAQDKDSIITSVSKSILTSNSIIESNLTPTERKGYSSLRNLQHPPLILPADKGGGIVLVDNDDYQQAVKEELKKDTYLRLHKSPLRSIKNLRTRWFHTNKLSYIPINTTESIPLLKLLPKIHKETKSWRPLISSSLSPLREVEKVIKPILKSTVKFRSISHRDFIHRLKHLSLHRGREYILSNFDVVSMFPSLNRNNLFSYLEDFLTSSVLNQSQIDLVLTGVKLCLDHDCVCWEDTHYSIVQGLGIGSTLSSYLAEIYIQHWEDEGPLKLPLTKSLVLWVRYVDDIFVLWEGDVRSLENFVSYLNNIDPSLQLTCSFDHLSLPFLDVRVTLYRHNFRFSWFRKRGYAGNFLHNRSDVSPYSKKHSIYNQIKRVIELNDCTNYMCDINFFFSVLFNRGYSLYFLKRILHKVVGDLSDNSKTSTNRKEEPNWNTFLRLPASLSTSTRLSCPIIFTSGPKLMTSCSILNNKNLDPMTQSDVIYSVPCSTCNSIYIGETGRLLSTRIKEHMRALKSGDTEHNAIANHAWTEQHRPDFNATSIVSREKSLHKRKFKEHLEIIINLDRIMNNNYGVEISSSWDVILSLLKV